MKQKNSDILYIVCAAKTNWGIIGVSQWCTKKYNMLMNRRLAFIYMFTISRVKHVVSFAALKIVHLYIKFKTELVQKKLQGLEELCIKTTR